MSADHEVGYKKPPTKNQFKKGQSGNPKGRKKGSKDMRTTFEQVLRQSVSIRQGDRRQSVPMQQAMFLALMAKATRGDTKALELALKTADKLQLLASSEAQPGAVKPSRFVWTEEDESLRPFIDRLIKDGRPILDDPEDVTHSDQSETGEKGEGDGS